MKKLIIILLFSLPFAIAAQNISVNNNGQSPDPSSMLDVSDTASGVLIPRMTQVQRDAIVNPATGLLIFQTDNDSGFYFNQGIPATPNWLRMKTQADTSLWKQVDTSLYYKGGFIGVGTDNPQGFIHLFGNGTFGTGTRVVFGDDYFYSGVNNGLNVNVGESGWYDNLDSDQLQMQGRFGHFFTVGGGLGPSTMDTALRINSFGNVGVGNENPDARFDVNADFGDFKIFDFAPGNGSVLLGTWQGDSVYPEVRFESTASSNFVDIGIDTNQNFVIQPNDNNYFTFKQNGGLSIRYDSLNFPLFIGNNGGGNSFTRIHAKRGQVGVWGSNDSVYWALLNDRTTGSLLPSKSVGFFHGSVSGPIWSASHLGYMGIGEDSAYNKLHISHSENKAMLRLTQQVNSLTSEAVFDIADTAEWTMGASGLNHGLGEGFFLYNIQRNTFDLFVDGDNGRFAIGHSFPTHTFDITSQGTDDPPLLSLANSDRSHFLTLFAGRLNDPNPYFMWQDGDPMRFVTNQGGFTELMRIESTGEVGIGTSTPLTTLDLRGDLSLGLGFTPNTTTVQNILNFQIGLNSDPSTNGISFNENTVGFGMKLGYDGTGTGNGNFIGIYGSSLDTLFTFTNGGWMGIGVTPPLAPLEIGASTGDVGMIISEDAEIGVYDGQDFEIVHVNTAGTITNRRFKISSTGNVQVAGSTVHSSDRRFKKDIQPIENVLNSLKSIDGVYYFWKKEEYPQRGFNSGRSIGMIAQSLQSEFPELVVEDEEGYLSVDYSKFSAVLLQAIKEQQLLIEKQERKQKEQDELILDLLKRIERLENK